MRAIALFLLPMLVAQCTLGEDPAYSLLPADIAKTLRTDSDVKLYLLEPVHSVNYSIHSQPEKLRLGIVAGYPVERHLGTVPKEQADTLRQLLLDPASHLQYYTLGIAMPRIAVTFGAHADSATILIAFNERAWRFESRNREEPYSSHFNAEVATQLKTLINDHLLPGETLLERSQHNEK